MPEVQIGKYKRPGIFIEEFDNSIIETPIISGLSALVIGFSKRGPVNTPVVVNTLTDLESIFGLDKLLEKKGSFFHRTASKILESNPVTCINLLITDDILDTLEYKSLSTSTVFSNDVIRTGPYRRFFDTTGFWKKDTESFLNITSSNVGDSNRVLHVTNMGDKPITVFMFKSKQKGFDITLLDWYGAIEKVPTYLYPTDYVSDYMVDTLVVAGDWSNYQELAIDPRWGSYFNTSGIIKSEVDNFANDINVTVLKYYTGNSLIPYFRDQNGKNIFIENIINLDTDKTGLFMSFDTESLETDLPNGLIDIVGNNLISGNISEIEYLSYQDSITETITFSDKKLDTPGNVLSFGQFYKDSGLNRSSFNSEGYVSGVTITNGDGSWTPNPSPSPSPFLPTSDTTYVVSFSVANGAYCIIGGQKIVLNETGSTISVDFTLNASDYVDLDDGLANGTTYASSFAVDTTGTIKHYPNTIDSNNPTISATDIVLSYAKFDVTNDGGSGSGTSTNYFTNFDVTYISVDDSGFVELAPDLFPYSHVDGTNGALRTDITISSDGNGAITYTFENTASAPDTSDYEVYRRIKFFNNIVNNIQGPNKNEMLLLIDNNIKNSLSTMTLTNVVTSNSQNKSFTINTNIDETSLTDLLGTNSPSSVGLLLYIKDDEFVMSTDSIKTKETYATLSEGIVSRYSDFYTKFDTGQINSGDFFYENLTSDVWDISFEDNAGDDFIVFFNLTASISFNTNDKILIPDSILNSGIFTIIDPNNQATSLGYGAGYFAYKVSENTSPELISGVSKVFDYNNKHYLQMYIDGSGNLNVLFTDMTLSVQNPIVDITSNVSIDVFSQTSNFRQTLEIESPVGWVSVPNEVLVDPARYSEVKVGDFLEAFVDESILVPGEVPKRLTRILSKKLWTQDSNYVVLSTDARIKLYDFNGDLQTFRITNVDDYVSTYKGIVMKGFKVRSASTPDGTEARQNDILNLVAKNTPIFKALTNKDVIQFRYVVDGFGLGLIERSKQQYLDICGDRLDCFGFINMPSMRSFKNSSSPTFVNSEGVLQTKFIAQGGDPESSPAFLYSFGDGPGVSAVGYFCPYLTANDNGRPVDVPPAMYAASTYLRKLNSTQTNIQPWTIAAGVRTGRITNIVNVEQEFSNEDIENFNGMKANPIVTKRNRGFVIETENTSQTLVTSALSFIHVREVLIELEGRLSDMLLEFQWKFNTPEVRSEIKLRADLICESYVTNEGLFNFFNKIDEENNTSDIIDNQIGILDTFVEPIKGMGIIVNNVTILRTGAIASGGFL